MNSLANTFYWFMLGAATLLSAMGIWFTTVVPGLDRWSRRFFVRFFSVLLVSCAVCLAEMILWYFPGKTNEIQFLQALECLPLSIPLPMLTVYLLHCSGEKIRSSKLFQNVLILWVIYFCLLISAFFIDGFTYDKADGQFHRGPLYPLFLLPLVAIMTLNAAGTIQRRKQLPHRIYMSFIIAMVPMTVSLIIQMFADVFPLIDISLVLSGLSMYGIILSDQIEQDLSHQREIALHQQKIAGQRASIMVLQMRPHFIYNTMTSIYCLCDQDPKLARQVIMDFTTYLRKNFTAIASAEPIPFTMELEHTRAYLAVEQAQYEDSLIVEYDTPHTMFRVPPLTLQPIVENAVKHGRDPYAGPFHISVRTRKTESASEIIVTDDGRGFDTADNSEVHIALDNIQQRLELMCGGSLTITPNEGGGTVVTVTIPDSPVNTSE